MYIFDLAELLSWIAFLAGHRGCFVVNEPGKILCSHVGRIYLHILSAKVSLSERHNCRNGMYPGMEQKNGACTPTIGFLALFWPSLSTFLF